MLVEFKEITKSYRYDFWSPKFFALEQVSFSIPEGSVVGFLGANGAGKTTSLKVMMDFIRPDAGEVVFSKILGQSKKEILSNLGFLPERPYFYPTLTGKQFCYYMGRLNGLTFALINERMKYWAHTFNIYFALDRKISTYSKGMLQRLGFVSCLLHDPKLIVLDEPLSGLDPVGRKEIKDALVALHRQGKTVFFSSHIVSDVEEICQEVVVLQKAKVLYQGSIDELIQKNLQNNYSIVFTANHLPERLQPYCVETRNDWHRLILPHEKKQEVLQIIQSVQGELLNLEADRPTLEQIIYQIRGVNHG